MSNNVSYVVSAYTSYGLLVYLSVMGYHVNGKYSYIWEPGFENARMFSTKAEAEQNADVALATLPGHGPVIIYKYTKTKDGRVEVSQVS
jgi:hypothetical protein